jgi:adenosine deaminase
MDCESSLRLSSCYGSKITLSKYLKRMALRYLATMCSVQSLHTFLGDSVSHFVECMNQVFSINMRYSAVKTSLIGSIFYLTSMTEIQHKRCESG